MTPARLRILTAIVAEPGELTAEVLAQEHGLDEGEVRKHLKALVRSGHVERGMYQIHPRDGAAKEHPWTPWIYVRIFRALRRGPCSGAELVDRMGMQTMTGKLQDAIDELVYYGDVITPSLRVATDKGRRLVEQTREEAA